MSGYTWRDPSRRAVQPAAEPVAAEDRRAHNWGGRCGHGCCWTPFDVCALARACSCHFELIEPAGLEGEPPLVLAADDDPEVFQTESVAWGFSSSRLEEDPA